jgi:PPOX class probable FMN-dependent enzyme
MTDLAMRDLTASDLERLYKAPHPFVLKKCIDHLDVHARGFIALSPFCVVSSSDTEGRLDVSPRGGSPGFIHIADDHTLLMPDRPGNNRLDTLRNVTGGTGRLGMMFMIPGFEDVLRVNGRAGLTADPALLAGFEDFGKLPVTLVRVQVEEVFFHCPKAIMRSGLWEAESQVPRDTLPTLTEMVSEQLGYPRAVVDEKAVEASLRETL